MSGTIGVYGGKLTVEKGNSNLVADDINLTIGAGKSVSGLTGGTKNDDGSMTYGKSAFANISNLAVKPLSTVTTAPTAKEGLTFNGGDQVLVNAGSATGGTMYYAVTTENTAPTDESLYKTDIPTAIDAGTYYVWYKAVAGKGGKDSRPAAVKVVIRKKPVTVTAKAQTIKEGKSIASGVKQVTLDGEVKGHTLSSVRLKADAKKKTITPDAVVIKDKGGKKVTGNYKITYKKGKLTVRKPIKVKVTFKVKHGAWNDGKSKSRTVTLTGYEGDSLKLAAKQIPAVGNKPAKGYKTGSWNKKPGIKTSLKKDTTYTYTYAKKPEPKPQEPTKKEKDKAALDAGIKATWNGADVTVEFGKVSGATAYDVYASYCGEKFALYDTMSGGKVTVKKLKGRKLDASKTVKVCVAARDGKKQLARTITAHVASPANKYTNAKQVTISGKPFKVEKG